MGMKKKKPTKGETKAQQDGKQKQKLIVSQSRGMTLQRQNKL